MPGGVMPSATTPSRTSQLLAHAVAPVVCALGHVFALLRWRTWRWLLIGSLCACTTDADVYRAVTDASPASAGKGGTKAGAGGRSSVAGRAAAGVGGAAAYTCGDTGTGGTSADQAGGASGNSSKWFRVDSCTSDADCGPMLFLPVCDIETGSCVPCPNAAQQAGLSALVGLCLGEAMKRCCRDPSSVPDCIFSDCVRGCGGR